MNRKMMMMALVVFASLCFTNHAHAQSNKIVIPMHIVGVQYAASEGQVQGQTGVWTFTAAQIIPVVEGDGANGLQPPALVVEPIKFQVTSATQPYTMLQTFSLTLEK